MPQLGSYVLSGAEDATFSFCLLTSFGLGWIYTFESLKRARTCGEFTGIGPRLRAGHCGRFNRSPAWLRLRSDRNRRDGRVNTPRNKLTHSTRNLEFLAICFGADIGT